MIRNSNERILELVESMCKDITVESQPSDSIYYHPPTRYMTNGVPLTYIYHDVRCLIDENEELQRLLLNYVYN